MLALESLEILIIDFVTDEFKSDESSFDDMFGDTDTAEKWKVDDIFSTSCDSETSPLNENVSSSSNEEYGRDRKDVRPLAS